MREEDVSLALFLEWLSAEHDRRFEIEGTARAGEAGLAATAGDGASRLAVEVHPLLPPSESGEWAARREELEGELARGLDGAYALWLPPGARLPADSKETADLTARVQETAGRLEPGQRAHVPLPVTLYLKKARDDGNLMSVAGEMNRYWARFTERIRGTFDLDSTRLHRLPQSEEHLEELIDRICGETERLEAVGQWVEIETVDAWTIQRLAGGEGVVIVGRPREELGEVGLSVRRNFRRVLAEAAPRLRDADAGQRALVVTGYYAWMEEEGASTAMRGYSPALYSGLDFVCLAADGRIKALMEAPSRSMS